MATTQYTLYLTATATGSPWPTTSCTMSTSAPTGGTNLGPGFVDSGQPGVTDAGGFNPSTPISPDTNVATEIDRNHGSAPGTTRQGWLWDQDLTGKTVVANTEKAWNLSLRLTELLNLGTPSFYMFMRVSVVTSNSGAWTTVTSQILTTNVTGGSPTNGHAGWAAATSNNTASTTPTTFTKNFGASIEHTFTSGQRLLFEFGYGGMSSATDITNQLTYDDGLSKVITPYIIDRITLTAAAGTSTVTGTISSYTTSSSKPAYYASLMNRGRN